MKKDNGDDQLEEEKEKWSIGGGIEDGLVPFNITSE